MRSQENAKKIMQQYQNDHPVRFILMMAFGAAGCVSMVFEVLLYISSYINIYLNLSFLVKVQSWHIFLGICFIYILDPKTYKRIKDCKNKNT